MHRRRKAFFSEEKKQKTFVPAPAEGCGLTPASGKLPDVRGFHGNVQSYI
jgi:hypothetical protein